jgi:hypothetical protein
VRKTCGIDLFSRNYRLLLQETLCLGAGFLSVCLETHLSGSKTVVSMSRDAPVQLMSVGLMYTIELMYTTELMYTIELATERMC